MFFGSINDTDAWCIVSNSEQDLKKRFEEHVHASINEDIKSSCKNIAKMVTASIVVAALAYMCSQ
ncbi:MAG: hypothetical protein K0R14_493 [Burkholderiales bacterium]|jgi:hypothetical protein|nr:hypothetical protein [Burkholderiales bacterium]